MEGTILLVDDHPIVRKGLKILLQEKAGFRVCGEASNRAEALDAAVRLRPELAIVDISLDGASGLDVVRDLKALHPEMRILVLSVHDELLFAERCLRAGANGYVMKSSSEGALLAAVRQVLQGHYSVSPGIASQIIERMLHGAQAAPAAPEQRLSNRELEVLRHLGKGKTTRQIAQLLRLSVKTVETHRAALKEKMGAKSASELVRRAVLWVEKREDKR